MPDSGARAAARLTPPQLAARLDRILACTGSLIASVPAPYLEHRASPAHGSPGQDSTLRELAFHVFRLGLGFADGMDLGRVSERWFSERAPADLSDGAAVARYGALVRARLGGWFEGAGTSEYARVIDVHDGSRSGHDLLEQVTAQAGQRLRELYALVAELGITPPDSLPAADLEGLPLPGSLW